MGKIHFGLIYVLFLGSINFVFAQVQTFSNIKIRFNRSEKDLRFVEKDAFLIFNDYLRHLIVKNIERPERPLNINYDDVQKVVFDVSRHVTSDLAEVLSASPPEPIKHGRIDWRQSR
jgi:hypothetical protein